MEKVAEAPRKEETPLAKVQAEMRKEKVDAWVLIIDLKSPGQSPAERFFSEVDRTMRAKFVGIVWPEEPPEAFTYGGERGKFEEFGKAGGRVSEFRSGWVRERFGRLGRIALDWNPERPFSDSSLCPWQFREFLLEAICGENERKEFARRFVSSAGLGQLVPAFPLPPFERAREAGDIAGIQEKVRGLMAENGIDLWMTFAHPAIRSEVSEVLLSDLGKPALVVFGKEIAARIYDIADATREDMKRRLHAFAEDARKEKKEGTLRVALDLPAGGAFVSSPAVPIAIYELVREAAGAEIVSSEPLTRAFVAWDRHALGVHQNVAADLPQITSDAFGMIRRAVLERKEIQEYEVAEFISSELRRLGMASSAPPVVASGPNSAKVHHTPTRGDSRKIRRGDVVFIDFTARLNHPDCPYADITWVGFVGTEEGIPQEVRKAFSAVVAARDAVVEKMRKLARRHEPLLAGELAKVAQERLKFEGFPACPHNIGHNLGFIDAGGIGPSIQAGSDAELIPGTGYTVEPGIYIEGKFGVRSEIDVYLGKNGEVVVTTPAQMRIMALF